MKYKNVSTNYLDAQHIIVTYKPTNGLNNPTILSRVVVMKFVIFCIGRVGDVVGVVCVWLLAIVRRIICRQCIF